MITMRSLLWEASTACWIEWYRHCLANARLRRVKLRACVRLILRSGCVGRSFQPCLRAAPTEFSRRLMESFWHTTRVLLVLDVFSAEESERAFGTSPPVHGLIEQSGAGSGQ